MRSCKLQSCAHRSTTRVRCKPACSAQQPPQQPGEVEVSRDSSRRAAVLALVATTAGSIGGGCAEAKGPATRSAGDFCPPAATSGFVVYTPDSRATPSIRAGVIKPEFYSFELPPSWVEGTILNILSGNFCMPRCDEPWYEVLWESKDEGRAKLVVSPLYRLISKSAATLQDLGPPEQVVERIGPFITGNYLDSTDDVVAMDTERFADGRTYYTYELITPYAKDAPHSYAAFGIKGDLAFLWVVAASEKQWPKSESTLRHMLTSFRA